MEQDKTYISLTQLGRYNSKIQAALSGKASTSVTDNLQTQIDTITKDGETKNVIDTFNEVKNFLAGYTTDDGTLKGIIDAVKKTADAANSYTDGRIGDIGTNNTGGTTTKKTVKEYVDAQVGTKVGSVTTGTTNGTILVDGKSVTIKGLNSAAYETTSTFATAAQGEKADSAIQAVKVNGAAITPDTNKAVNIAVPTKVSELTNDKGYLTSVAGNLPVATSTTLGGVIVGSNLTVDSTGKISVDTDKIATKRDLGVTRDGIIDDVHFIIDDVQLTEATDAQIDALFS